MSRPPIRAMRFPNVFSIILLVVFHTCLVNAQEEDSEEAIPDKVGAEIHLKKTERSLLKNMECQFCRAIMKEMHIEVARHDMTKKGESHVWETANAMCLGLLQKYRLNLQSKKLERKSDDEDDEQSLAKSGGNRDEFVRAMLVLKMGCQRWVEDYGSETSGFIYKSVKEKLHSADDAAQDFCVNYANLCGKSKAEKRKQEKAKEKERQQKRREMMKKEDEREAARSKDDPLKALPESSKLGLQQMLEAAKNDPLQYMDDEAKQRIQQARTDLRCEVCRVVFDEVHNDVLKRPKAMQREHDILPFMEAACTGGEDLSLPNYFGIEPPPLPPLWTDKYRPHFAKKTKHFVLRKFKKGADARKKWRTLTKDGKQKPPPVEEGEQDMMLTMTCKDFLEPERMAEVLYDNMVRCSSRYPDKNSGKSDCDAALAAAKEVCKSSGDAPCSFTSASGSDNSKKQEL